MSSETGPDAAEVISTYKIIFVDNLCAFSVLALVIYDYLVTIRREVELFWKRKVTGATVLFLLNRYILVADYVFNTATIARTSSGVYGEHHLRSRSPLKPLFFRCDFLVKIENVTYILVYIPWAAFGGLRAYALTDQNWILSLLIFFLALVPFGLNFSQFFTGLTGIIDPVFGCTEVLPVTPEFGKRLTIASRTTLMASDVLLILITLRTIWLPRRGEMGWAASSLAAVLLRDGLLYFVALFTINTLHLVFTMIAIINPLDPVSNVTIFTQPITAILVSRFLLDLQAANKKMLNLNIDQNTQSGSSTIPTGTLIFERVVGSIATSLGVDDDAEDLNEDLNEDPVEHELKDQADGGNGVQSTTLQSDANDAT